MSELSAPMPYAALAASTGFRSDARFAEVAATQAIARAEPEDPLAVAWAEGFIAGGEQARGEAAGQAGIEAEAREALSLSLARIDSELQEQLRQRLRDCVAALCETALAPLALDETALLARIDRAVAMFARADDERVIRLHPDDIALVSPKLAADWQVLPDPSLARGALRVESAQGGVEDGPAEWRAAIAEAMHLC